jgi:hypothetical protein
MNDPTLEPKVQTLNKENRDKLYELRRREQNGILPPVIIRFEKD